MTEILLRELTNTDIDWIVTSGEQQQVPAGTLLLKPGQISDSIHLVLSGKIKISIPATSAHPEQDIAQFPRGDILGLPALLDDRTVPCIISAEEDSTLLTLSRSKLTEKLRQDIDFAARFYRAAALILSERVRQMFEMPEQLSFGEGQSVKEALFVFGELCDSDIDWLVSVGQVKRLVSREILLHAGRPVDALYIILDGTLAISVPEGQYDPLSLCFSGLEKTTRSQSVLATISKGGLPGIVSFLDSRPLPVTIRSVNESLVFDIPRQRITIKLQEDPRFAARFCRVIATQLCELLYTVLDRLGCDQTTYDQQPMAEQTEYEDELDLESLEQISQGANRFNWMLKRLGVGCTL